MTEVLNDFIRALRAADVRVSTSESIDAGRTLALLGFGQRQALRDALSQVLAKSEGEKAAFGEVFDRYFAFRAFDPLSPPGGDHSRDAQNPQNAGGGPSGAGGGGAAGQPTGPSSQSLAQLMDAGDQTALEMAMAEAARQVRLNQIQMFTQRGRYTVAMLEAMGIAGLDEEIERRRERGPAAGQRLWQQRDALRQQVLDYVEKQLELFTANAGRQLREEVLSRLRLENIPQRDMKQMHELVRKLAKRLVALHSRRRRVDVRGQLDVRRTIRANVEYGGPLFHTLWKQARVDRPKVMAVCDVSGSVARASGFLLTFLHSLHELLPRARTFAFSGKLGETTALFDQARDFQEAVGQTLKTHGMGATDYGQAFMDFERLAGRDIDHRTTLLILGDARSNGGNPRGDILKKLHARARRVIWLNPEPRYRWGSGDSEMPRLAPYCDTVKTCASLRDLERVVSELLRHAG